jgi:uncharacterized Ntn-hydrolase superfamily protein
LTFSIIGRDPQNGEIGIAVASMFFAVGGVVPYLRADCAVATQCYANPFWALEGLVRMKDGAKSQHLLEEFIQRDRGASIRQVHMLDSAGQFNAHTGSECPGWAGHLIGQDASAAGNLLVGEAVLNVMLNAFACNAGMPMPERLLASLEAGDAAGGDKRGRQSAALVVHRGQDYPILDIRADDSDAPIPELRRLLSVSKQDFASFVETMPTTLDFST